MARKIIRDEIKEQKKSKKKITTITAFMTDTRTADICSTKFQEIINMSENDPEEIRNKEKKYEDLRTNENYQQALNEANIWTSTFFWPFEGTALGEIPIYTTIEQLRIKLVDPELDTVECGKCGEKLNPMFVLQEIANKDNSLVRRWKLYNPHYRKQYGAI